MTIFAIGDIQGCFQELQQLLKKIKFSTDKDQLWFTGDLVNRGPESLAVLRFVKDLKENAITVLGNHDLHMLAVVHGLEKPRKKDTFKEILQASDRDALMEWITQQPLMHCENENVLVHAGIYPDWSIEQAAKLAKEVEAVLQSDKLIDFMKNMYGNQPKYWSDEHSGWDRLRFITNCFTRMRFCTTNKQLDMQEKCKPGNQSRGLFPWFELRNENLKQYRILFGHWSTLGMVNDDKVVSLDSGCLWGGKLTAIALQDPPYFTSLDCHGAMQPGND